MSASRVKVDYAEVLKARAAQYAATTAAPEHKALDHTQLRNMRNINRWRDKYCKLVQKEDIQ